MSDLHQRELNPLKVLHHVDRLRALAAGRDVAPVTVEIDPVAYCNHDCGWCVDPVHTADRMALETFERLIAELADFTVEGFRVEGIVFKGGGEPTLHPDFGSMVELATDHGFAVGVVTNGSHLESWGEVLAQRAAYVRVSVDGPTPESHRRIHRSKDFEQIVAGIRQLVRLRGTRRHPIVGLSFAMDVHSVHLAPQALALGEDLGVHYVLLRPPFFEEVGREPTMTVEQAHDVRQRLRDAAAEHEGAMDVLVGNWIGDVEQAAAKARELSPSGRRDERVDQQLPIEHRTGRCLASPVLAVVTADGNLYGCCNLRALRGWSFGRLDYAAGVGFAALWQSPGRLERLSSMHRTDCIRHCTHPLSRYNEMIEALKDTKRPHSQFL
jgi:MoaA/NifB/PqqE/SkfB family radical SAM enzyme